MFDQTFHQFHDLDTFLDLHPITTGFHGAFATGVVCQQGNAYSSRHLVLSLFYVLIIETRFLGFTLILWLPYQAWPLPHPEIFMEHLWQVWHTSRERLPFWTPGSVLLFGTSLCSICWDQFPELAVSFLDFSPWISPWYFLNFALHKKHSFYNGALIFVKIPTISCVVMLRFIQDVCGRFGRFAYVLLWLLSDVHDGGISK